jgi:hypothetical protein
MTLRQRITQHGEVDRRSDSRVASVERLAELLSQRARSVAEIESELGVCRRSVYLLIDQLTRSLATTTKTVARLGSRSAGTYAIVVTPR